MIAIRQEKDPNLITALNHELQDHHAELLPHIFKRFDFDKIYPSIQKMLSKNTTYAFVAYDEKLPVGYVLCLEQELTENGFHYPHKSILVDQMGVLSEYQQQGVGKKLMDAVEEFAKDKGIDSLELTVWAVNERAKGFYDVCGFEPRIHHLQKKL